MSWFKMAWKRFILLRDLLFQQKLGKKKTDALREWYMNRAKEKIIPRVKRYARQFGVDVAEIKIVDNRFTRVLLFKR